MENKVKIILDEINEKESSLKGKIVAIEPESGDYFIGNSVMDSYKKAAKKYPSGKFIFKKIGFEHTHFIGSLE